MIMKYLFTVLFLSIACLAKSQEGITFDETMSWVKGRYDSQELIAPTLEDSTYFDFELLYEGCDCQVKYKTIREGKSENLVKDTTVWLYQFDLSKSQEITSKWNSSYYDYVEVHTLLGQKVFLSDVLDEYGNSIGGGVLKVDHVYIPTGKDLAPRIAKALNDAMKKCK